MSAPDRIWVRGNDSAVAWQGKVDRDGFDPRIAGCFEYLLTTPARLHAEELAEALREIRDEPCIDPDGNAAIARAVLAKLEEDT